MTTKELRTKDFELIVPVGSDGKAEGELYLDDGLSLVQKSTTYVKFTFDGKKLKVKGKYGYNAGVNIVSVTFLGLGGKPRRYEVDGKSVSGSSWKADDSKGEVVVQVGKKVGDFEVSIDQ